MHYLSYLLISHKSWGISAFFCIISTTNYLNTFMLYFLILYRFNSLGGWICEKKENWSIPNFSMKMKDLSLSVLTFFKFLKTALSSYITQRGLILRSIDETVFCCAILEIASGANIYAGFISVVLVNLLGLDKLRNAFGLLLMFHISRNCLGDWPSSYWSYIVYGHW